MPQMLGATVREKKMASRMERIAHNGGGVKDFRHEETKRRNNPPAGMASTYEVRDGAPKTTSTTHALDQQLVSAGKAEHTSLEVGTVSLDIHDCISTRAILDAVRRPVGAKYVSPLQLDSFGETPLPADQEIEFYKREVDRANRLILGDSLLVMNSLLVKEGMAGKAQMIYIDPPYGIKYASEFQPRIDGCDVKDQHQDLTREAEQIELCRDAWKVGIHSYLTYMRDRLLLARKLATESGSVFVQINDENLHLVRCLMGEVFGRDNFVAAVGKMGRLIPGTFGCLLWYARDKSQDKNRAFYFFET